MCKGLCAIGSLKGHCKKFCQIQRKSRVRVYLLGQSFDRERQMLNWRFGAEGILDVLEISMCAIEGSRDMDEVLSHTQEKSRVRV